MGRRTSYHHGDLRDALVAGALELVAEKGVAGLSVAEVARRIGVSTAAPYRHFASRVELLSAAATVSGRRLSDQMHAASDAVPPDPDEVAHAVEVLAALAAAYVRYALAHGAAFELVLANELNDHHDAERRDVTRGLFDQLLWPAVTITGDVMAANPLLRGFTAVVHGYAYRPAGGFGGQFPTDLRGFATEEELVADEAAHAVRVLARASVPA